MLLNNLKYVTTLNNYTGLRYLTVFTVSSCNKQVKLDDSYGVFIYIYKRK